MIERFRVLFWSQSFWPNIGGIETWAARYVTSLRDRGLDVTVITAHLGFDAPNHECFQGIPVHRLPLQSALRSENPTEILHSRQALAKIVESVAPHCIHLNTCGPMTAFYLWTRNTKSVPMLFTLHEAWHDLCASPESVLTHTLDRADYITAVSEATRNWALKMAPHIDSRIETIYPATNPHPVPSSPLSKTLLCIGRLVREKGVDLAIKALVRVLARHPDARLIIAGDGLERDSLVRLALDLEVSHAVEFTGWVNPSAIPTLMARTSLVIVPSRREGFGLAALEAAHLGRPTVGFAVGGLPEVIVNNQTGLLVAPEDTNALAEQINRLLADPALQCRLGVMARQRARTKFLWEHHMDKYEHTIRRLCRQSQMPQSEKPPCG